MTTGSDQFGGNPNTTMATGIHRSRTWSGSDGRTEPYAGGIRTKWNAYTGDLALRTVTRPTARYLADVNWPGTPPNWLQFDDTYTHTFFGPFLSLSASDDLKLQSKLVEKVKGHNFNLAVNVAQLGLTVDMLSQNLSKLGKSMWALKHGDFVTAARSLGARPKPTRLKGSDISGRWLELQYGWVPLLSDCFEAAKAFEAISSGPRKSLFRTSVKIERSDSQEIGTTSQKIKKKATRYLQYEMYEEMSVGRQLGLADPLSVVWEIIPYSFVVDWFVPIGAYLDNLNAIPKLKGRFLTTTVTRYTGFDEGWSTSFLALPKSRRGVWLPSVNWKRIIVTRTPSTTLSPPLPGSFDPSGISHGRRLWNAIALASQAFAPPLIRAWTPRKRG